MREVSPYAVRRIASDPPGLVLLPPRPRPVTVDGIGLSECWQVVQRHSRLIVGLTVLTLVIVAVVLLMMTPNYTASTTLLIEPEPPRVLNIKELINEGDSSVDYDYYKTEFAMLKSRDLAASVIRQLNLANSPMFAGGSQHYWATSLWLDLLAKFRGSPDEYNDPNAVSQKVVDAYLHRLTVTPELGTRLVKVSFSAPNPVLAQRIVDTHVHDFIQRDLDLRSQSGRSAVRFLQGELAQIKKRVQTSEAALQSYRHKNGILSFDVQNENKVAERRMENLTRALTAVQTKRIAAEAQVQLVRAGDYESLPQVISNPIISALEPRVQQLQAKYADMATAFNPAYPKLAELKAELSSARQGLQREIDRIADAVERNYKADVDEENRLVSEINAEKERDFALNDASLEDSVLAREVEANRQLYKNVLLRMQQIAVGQQAPVSNISVVDRAVIPALPSTPKKRRDLAIAGLLALICGLSAAFILDKLDDRLKTAKEAEDYLQLPALAVAPDFDKLDRTGGLSSSLRFGGTLLLSLLTHRSRGPNRIFYRTAAQGDVYRSIRTALLFSQGEPPPRKVLITSAVSGEGKTWTAVNTALAFAKTGAKTLLIDADLRRSRCHVALRLGNRTGLSEVLTGQCDPNDAIQTLEGENLSLLSSGSRVTNPSELLTSSRMSQLLDWLSQPYDYILIDSAPLMLASDTLGIATMTSGVVLVAGAQTPKQDIRRAADLLSFVGANLLGLVLNRVDFQASDYKNYSRYYFSYDDTIEATSSAEFDVFPTTHS